MRVCRPLITAVLAVAALTGAVYAKSVTYTPYEGYEYNSYGESEAAPVSHVPAGTVTSADMGLQLGLSSPSDMVLREDGLYILDSQNGRVVHLGSDLKAVRVLSGFTDGDGNPVDFTGAKGLAVHDNGTIYVADTDHERVLALNPDERRVLCVIGRPEEALQSAETPFKAVKVLIDRKERIYVLVESDNNGAFVFDSGGGFISYFGSNPVAKTPDVLLNYFRKRFLTGEQRRKLLLHTPVTFSNFDIDKDGFIFTVTPNTKSTPGEGLVRKLNYLGNNVLSEDGAPLVFGDLEWDRVQFQGKTTSFVDIDVDSQGYMNLLDGGRNKVFQYTQTGQLIGAFGGTGSQSGQLTAPAAVESAGDEVLVLDSSQNCLYRYSPTEYALLLREAFHKLDDSDTEGALALWTQAMRANTNSLYPYYGMGISFDAAGDYEQAMKYFRLSGARDEYSKSFSEYRGAYIRSNLPWLLPLVLLLLAGLVLALRFVKRRITAGTGTAFSPLEIKPLFPLYTALHPADGFEQFRTRKIMSYRLSFLIVLLWFVSSTVRFFSTGFIFNQARPEDFNLLATFSGTVGLFVLFVAANWSICTLMDGKGNLKQITAVAAYSLLPFVAFQFIYVLLSNAMIAEEAAFLGILQLLALGWSAVLLVAGMYSIHQYSFLQTLGSLFLNVIGAAVIGVLLILLFTLTQQTLNFGRSLFEEFSLRQ
jgi:tetratricopeptide (TPR) repeat protein